MEKVLAWAKAHKIWAAVIAFFIIGAIATPFSGETEPSGGDRPNTSEASGAPEQPADDEPTEAPTEPTEPTASAEQIMVTQAEIKAFSREVRAQVPQTKKLDNSALAITVQSICRKLDSGQTYGEVSEDVAILVGAEPGSGAVDDVIGIAFDTACPHVRSKALG